jgi:hypothetical protein
MLPFEWPELNTECPSPGDTFTVKGIRAAVESGQCGIPAVWSRGSESRDVTLLLPGLTEDDRKTILAGCLMNVR